MPEGHAEVGVVSGESQFDVGTVEQFVNHFDRARRFQVRSISKAKKTAKSGLPSRENRRGSNGHPARHEHHRQPPWPDLADSNNQAMTSRERRRKWSGFPTIDPSPESVLVKSNQIYRGFQEKFA
jgi:hypothetical protein